MKQQSHLDVEEAQVDNNDWDVPLSLTSGYRQDVASLIQWSFERRHLVWRPAHSAHILFRARKVNVFPTGYGL